ncbi:hypothetical protein MHK_009921 [Candidatus Magnetomorum sp. HK-1]|nr:hypothetical protein MHK_009921 [Candidatus Magnetomorum sp. HK-1]
MTDAKNITIDSFISDWKTDSNAIKNDFIALKTHLENKSNTNIDFNARPGVSYSLRAAHTAQKKRSLFVMVDVIDDDPDSRWLSVCFYGEMITDPDEKGDLIPEGLLGEDGYCFDHDTGSESGLSYIQERIDEAYISAGKE